MIRHHLNVVDLFAGCGALSAGFNNVENNPYNVVLANEIDPHAAKAYELNHPSTEMFLDDVKQLTQKKIRLITGLKKNEIDVVIGGPPCQGFSAAGNRFENDPRNKYFLEFIRLIKELNPTVSVLENVPQFLTTANGRYAKIFSKLMSKLGYKTRITVLLASDYGIPQVRKRAICISVKNNFKDEITFPAPTHEKILNAHLIQKGNLEGIARQEDSNLEKFVSISDTIADLPKLNPKNTNETNYSKKPFSDYQKERRKKSKNISHHEYWGHSKLLLKYISKIPEGGRMIETYSEDMWKGKGFGQAYGRLHRNGVGQTITTFFHNPGSGRFIHYRDLRAISVREAARIQGFDDNFIFYGSKTQQEKQVGNAVPPLLAQKIGEHVYQSIFLKKTVPILIIKNLSVCKF